MHSDIDLADCCALTSLTHDQRDLAVAVLEQGAAKAMAGRCAHSIETVERALRRCVREHCPGHWHCSDAVNELQTMLDAIDAEEHAYDEQHQELQGAAAL